MYSLLMNIFNIENFITKYQYVDISVLYEYDRVGKIGKFKSIFQFYTIAQNKIKIFEPKIVIRAYNWSLSVYFWKHL